MANTLKDSEQNVICGLGTWTHTTMATGMYSASARCEENPPSSLTITLAQSGSTSASVTSAAPAATQGAVQLATMFNCIAGDVITVTIASSVSTDEQLNTVKTTVRVYQGLGQ